MLQLYNYQSEAVQKAREKLTTNNECLLVAPCASGKTVLSSHIINLKYLRDECTLIIVPFTSLINQFKQTLLKFDIPEQSINIQAGDLSTPITSDSKIVIAMAQTIERRGLPDLPFSLIIWDEAHLSYFRYQTHLQLKSLKCKHILLTATPWRADGAKFPCKPTQVISTSELIKRGKNSPFNYFPLAQTEIPSFNELSLDEESEILSSVAPPEVAYKKLSECGVFDEKSVFFFSKKQIAKNYIEYFEQFSNKPFELITDSTKECDRQKAYKKFRDGKCLLATVTCLAIGFDEPSVKNIVLLRTFSKGGFALFTQILGRGLRVAPGKTHCDIYDLCSNPYFPLPDEVLDWNDSNIPYTKKGKMCGECGTIVGQGMPRCYKCGAKLKSTDSKVDELESSILDFINSVSDNNFEAVAKEQHRQIRLKLGAKSVKQFVERLSTTGQPPEVVYKIFCKMACLVYDYKPGWVFHQFKKMFPDSKIPSRLHAVFGNQPTYGNYLFYREYLHNHLKDSKGGSAKIISLLAQEFGRFNIEFGEKFDNFEVR